MPAASLAALRARGLFDVDVVEDATKDDMGPADIVRLDGQRFKQGHVWRLVFSSGGYWGPGRREEAFMIPGRCRDLEGKPNGPPRRGVSIRNRVLDAMDEKGPRGQLVVRRRLPPQPL